MRLALLRFIISVIYISGVYNGLAPSLLIVDPVLVDVIMKSAFHYFTDRGIYMDRNHPITVNIFAQTGNEWKVARVSKIN